MRAAVVGLLVATAFVLSGCQYLLGGMMGSPILPSVGGSFDPGDFGSFDPGDFGSFDPAFSFPPPDATYSKGSATVTIDGKATTYDTLAGPSTLMVDYGAGGVWTDGQGHYLQVYGAKTGDPTIDSEAGYLSVERIADNQHWTTADQSGCTVVVATADKTGFTGTATCKGLRWSDAISPVDATGKPVYIDGQAPFDLEVTFTATP